MVRSCIRLSFFEVTPNPKTVLALDVSGVIVGVMPSGNRLLSVASRSAITCLLRYISVDPKPGSSSNMTVTIDKPGMDCERISRIPTVPAILVSMGCVTRVSTNSADKPGDSVWMMICVGENSGNTSKWLLVKL